MNPPGHPSVDWAYMVAAIAEGDRARMIAPPNPWVGAVLVEPGGRRHVGHTERPGGRHAERVALDRAGSAAVGSTLYVTLEPCSHHGRTPPCVDAVIEAGVARVVVAIRDPDPNVAGGGLRRLRDAGLEVEVGVGADRVSEQLEAYLHHRTTGRPFVVAKMACTLDGRVAAADGSSRWITGPEARADGHRLRATADAILVGAGTVRADDPSLTVRDWTPPAPLKLDDVQPIRVVLGTAPPDARAQPFLEVDGDLREVLRDLADRGVVELLVEGGPTVIGDLQDAGLIDEYVIYLAPAVLGPMGTPMFAGDSAETIDDIWRGDIVGVERLGSDLRIRVRPRIP
ncbi:MAG: bifunctional diaminohydroxyphosphoribosylaminopyrimidine deaminase/5-amino-6-(5-phosphoribosylamino)uracil reductase RibD [Acidimicrobiales bacterium]